MISTLEATSALDYGFPSHLVVVGVAVRLELVADEGAAADLRGASQRGRRECQSAYMP